MFSYCSFVKVLLFHFLMGFCSGSLNDILTFEDIFALRKVRAFTRGNFRKVQQDSSNNKMPLPLAPKLKPPLLEDKDIAVSKSKLNWENAKSTCEAAGLILMVIESQEDNAYFNETPRLKTIPYKASTSFWSAGRFTSTEYTTLLWEPSKEPFPDFLSENSNGILKRWASGEPNDDEGKGKDLCLAMKFYGFSPPSWFASDCSEEKYFICMRSTNERQAALNNPSPALPVTIVEKEVIKLPKAYIDIPVPGAFFPDNDIRKVVYGILKPGSQIIFTPKDSTGGMLRSTVGTFKATKTNTKIYPFQTFHGAMKPHPVNKGSSIFKIDKLVYGEFKPDIGVRIIPGGISPTGLFTSDINIFTNKAISGTWKQNIGVLPNHPSRTIRGTLVPTPGSSRDAQFTPDDNVQGYFIRDSDRKTKISGIITQSNPPILTPSPDVKISHFEALTPGSWKPKLLTVSSSITHCVFKNIGNSFALLLDPELAGTFIPDNDVSSPIVGYMTETKPQIFTPITEVDLQVPIPGKWMPNNNSEQNELHGHLRPDSNLPPESAIFEIGDYGLTGKFYPDDRPKVSIAGKMVAVPPFEFTPNNLNVDLSRSPNGTWIPDNPINPNDPFSAAHGIMVYGKDGSKIFNPDSIMEGVFISDSTQIPIPGTMDMESNPKIFTAFGKKNSFKDPVSGIWRCTRGSSPQYPFSTIHGIMIPNKYVPQSATFAPDDIKEGQLTLEGQEIPIMGGMTQGGTIAFIPEDPVNITVDTPATWKPLEGISANQPFSVVHGTVKAPPDNSEEVDFYVFVPFDKVNGIFLPDDILNRPMKGVATQSNPSRFIAEDLTVPIRQPMSGTWKPLEPYVPADDTTYFSHCVLKPADKAKMQFTPLFKLDALTPGKFILDDDPFNPVNGSLTTGKRPVFKADNGEPLYAVAAKMPGRWIPLFSQYGSFNKFVYGFMNPSRTKSLPLFYVYFEEVENQTQSL